MANLAQKWHFWDFGQTFTAYISQNIEVNLEKVGKFALNSQYANSICKKDLNSVQKYHLILILYFICDISELSFTYSLWVQYSAFLKCIASR